MVVHNLIFEETTMRNSAQKIHCIGFWPDYDASFFASAYPTHHVNVVNPFELFKAPWLLKKWPRVLKECYFILHITQYIKQNRHDRFIFGEHRILFQALNKLKFQIRASVLLRNPITKPNGKIVQLLALLKDKGYCIWSFDSYDSERFGFLLYRQFIASLTSIEAVQATIDFSFIGRDKGRKSMLDHLANTLMERGYSCYFDARERKRPNLSYFEYLQCSLRARCLIDIVQSGQVGLTLRPLEALIYKRKLLTNNPTILKQDFYRPENILLIDESIDLEDVDRFMRVPCVDVEDSIKELYSVRHFLDCVLQD
jgi:hypothetical protein